MVESLVKFKIGRSKKVGHGPWTRGNPIGAKWADGTLHSTDFDIRVSRHDGLFHHILGGRKVAVFNSKTGEKNGHLNRIPGLFRFRVVRRAARKLEPDSRGNPTMPYQEIQPEF